MTEYKQLTASGQSRLYGPSLFRRLVNPLVFPGSPDGMFTAGAGCFRLPPTAPVRSRHFTSPSLHLGPVSESDFFTWEALICGPKDTPFVKFNFFVSFRLPFC